MEHAKIARLTWKELKQALVKQGLLQPVFTTALKVRRRARSTPMFEPLLLSTHIERLAELTEKCLALRREIRELEILAVKSIMDFQLFQKTSVIDEEVEELRLLKTSKVAEKKGHDAAILAFGTTPALNGGFRAIAIGRSEALQQELKSVERLSELNRERWANLKAYQQAYYARYTEKGNAHNYAERAENLCAILKEELAEALDRAIAVDLGLRTIYGWSPGDLPTQVDLLTLDAFVLWVLEARRGINWRSERETCFDLVIPLVQPWSKGKDGLISKAAFDAALGTGGGQPISLQFKMDSALFFNQEVRLKGIGLSFGNKFALVVESGIDRIQTADGFAKLAATIITPEQTNDDGRKYRRPNITLGNIGLHDSNPAEAFVEGVTVTNLCPVGSWEIRLHPWVVWKEADALKLSEGVRGERIRDLKLTLRAYIPARG